MIPTPVSAYHNYGVHDLMERVLSHLPAPAASVLEDEDSDWDDQGPVDES